MTQLLKTPLVIVQINNGTKYNTIDFSVYLPQNLPQHILQASFLTRIFP